MVKLGLRRTKRLLEVVMLHENDFFHDAFVGEHRSTERVLLKLRALAINGRWSELSSSAEAMSRALRTHIEVEEDYVYRAVEQYADDELMRTLAALRKRHLEIPVYALEIIDAAHEKDTEEALASIALLERVLTDHHNTEETEIFPLFAPEGPLESAASQAAGMLGKNSA